MNYGHRLTQREYERAIVELHSGQLPSQAVDQRRRELDLTIDHRLGIGFPADRREALWRIQQQVEAQRLKLALWWIASLFLPRALENRSNRVAQFVLDAYAQVLAPEEMEAYFGAA